MANAEMKSADYQLGLYEKALPDFDSWTDKLSTARDCGFDWVEISVDESDKKLERLDRGKEQVAEIKKAIAASGVPVLTMCLSAHRRFPLGSRDGAVRGKSLDIMKKAVVFSAELGVRIIQLAGYDVYYEQHGQDTEKYFRDGLFKASELASEYGVILGFETMETPFMDTVEKSRAYVDLVNSPFLGIYPDIGNLKNASVIYGTDVADDLKTGSGHIFASHLKETGPGIYRDMLFGQGGHTEYVRCIRELWSQGVRMYTGEMWHRGEEDYAEILKYSSHFLRDKIESAAEGSP